MEFVGKMKTENMYDNISWVEKEAVGFPSRYIQLTHEQRMFVDTLFDSKAPMNQEIIEQLEELSNDMTFISKEIDRIKNEFTG